MTREDFIQQALIATLAPQVGRIHDLGYANHKLPPLPNAEVVRGLVEHWGRIFDLSQETRPSPETKPKTAKKVAT